MMMTIERGGIRTDELIVTGNTENSICVLNPSQRLPLPTILVLLLRRFFFPLSLRTTTWSNATQQFARILSRVVDERDSTVVLSLAFRRRRRCDTCSTTVGSCWRGSDAHSTRWRSRGRRWDVVHSSRIGTWWWCTVVVICVRVVRTRLRRCETGVVRGGWRSVRLVQLVSRVRRTLLLLLLLVSWLMMSEGLTSGDHVGEGARDGVHRRTATTGERSGNGVVGVVRVMGNCRSSSERSESSTAEIGRGGSGTRTVLFVRLVLNCRLRRARRVIRVESERTVVVGERLAVPGVRGWARARRAGSAARRSADVVGVEARLVGRSRLRVLERGRRGGGVSCIILGIEEDTRDVVSLGRRARTRRDGLRCAVRRGVLDRCTTGRRRDCCHRVRSKNLAHVGEELRESESR